MRPYTPDSGLNVLGINNSLGSDYSLRLCRHCDSISSMFLNLVSGVHGLAGHGLQDP